MMNLGDRYSFISYICCEVSGSSLTVRWGGGAVVRGLSSTNREVSGSSLTVSTDDPLE